MVVSKAWSFLRLELPLRYRENLVCTSLAYMQILLDWYSNTSTLAIEKRVVSCT